MRPGFIIWSPRSRTEFSEAIEHLPGPTFVNSGIEVRYVDRKYEWTIPDTPSNAGLIHVLQNLEADAF